MSEELFRAQVKEKVEAYISSMNFLSYKDGVSLDDEPENPSFEAFVNFEQGKRKHHYCFQFVTQDGKPGFYVGDDGDTAELNEVNFLQYLYTAHAYADPCSCCDGTGERTGIAKKCEICCGKGYIPI